MTADVDTRPPERHSYTLTNPLAGHEPRVGRTQTGLTPTSPSRPLYGTTLRCSCGWTPNRRAVYENGERVRSYPDAKVSNEAPSKGGRTAASYAYRRHVSWVLLRPIVLAALVRYCDEHENIEDVRGLSCDERGCAICNGESSQQTAEDWLAAYETGDAELPDLYDVDDRLIEL